MNPKQQHINIQSSMKYIKIIEPIGYVSVMYYSLIQLAEHNDIGFFAFAFIGCLAGFVKSTVNLAIDKHNK